MIADKMLKKSVKEKNFRLESKGMTAMVDFVISFLAFKNEDGTHRCDVIGDTTAHEENLKAIHQEMRDRSTRLGGSNGTEQIYFNKQDITAEMKTIYDAWVESDYMQFGYILGDTLRRKSGSPTANSILLL